MQKIECKRIFYGCTKKLLGREKKVSQPVKIEVDETKVKTGGSNGV